jgi:hypothetical protein
MGPWQKCIRILFQLLNAYRPNDFDYAKNRKVFMHDFLFQIQMIKISRKDKGCQRLNWPE